MASIPGRPYSVGFTFRIISITELLFGNVTHVFEYNYDSTTFAFKQKRELLSSVPYPLAKGRYIEFTVGVNNNDFTIVFIECGNRCEVCITISIIFYG